MQPNQMDSNRRMILLSTMSNESGDWRPHSPRNQQRGFISVVTLFAAFVLATFSIGILTISEIGMKVNMEKQILDTHAMMVGKATITQGIDHTCANGLFIGDSSEGSESLFNQIDDADPNDRRLACQDDAELIIREEGDPGGPPGSFRRYRVSSTHYANALDDQNNDQEAGVERDVIIEVREIHAEVEKPRPQVMLLLDYSGSMNSNNRANSLREAVTTFVNQNYELDYGVIIYDSGTRRTIPMGSAQDPNHNQNVLAIINNEIPSGGTGFSGPLTQAIGELLSRTEDELFIVLVSDGQPSDRGDTNAVINQSIRGIDPVSCVTRQGPDRCITVYTLGVDNADIDFLEGISGNAATLPIELGDFVFEANAAQTEAAFADILADILCRFGPITPAPRPEEEHTINIFLNERPLIPVIPPDEAGDFSYEPSTGSVKLYDNAPNFACTNVIEQGGEVTIRYGQPRLIHPEQP